jgi:hypothetical protein
MANCEDGSCAVRDLTREEKRNEYNYTAAKILETWSDLSYSLIAINQCCDTEVEVSKTEELLHDAWDEFIHAAKIIPAGNAEHDRLVTLLLQMRELGSFHRKRMDRNGEMEVTEMSNGQIVWTDMPYLLDDLLQYWFNESTSLSSEEIENLAAFTSKLCGSGVCANDAGGCALWLFKQALENDADTLLHKLLPACIQWLSNANFKLAKLSVENCTPAAKDLSALLPGSRLKEVGVTEPGFSLERWLFWRDRLGKLYVSADPEISKLARQGFELMIKTGREVGIKIPGEKVYLERLFVALDQELISRSAKGYKDCVEPKDIEIDPAWANE